MTPRYRVAWAALAFIVAIVMPFRLVEISQAHADSYANKARYAAFTPVRG